jgi:hypothetical protein
VAAATNPTKKTLNPRVIENMDRAEIKFNEETGKPFTTFPTTEK